MVGQKTRGDEYLEIEQRKIELEEQLLDLQERRIDIEQRRIELELRKIKLLSRKSKRKSKRNQPARDESPDGAQMGEEERGSAGNMDSEDDDDHDDYEATIGGTIATHDHDDDYDEDEDDEVEEEEAPIKEVVKEKKSSRRSFRRSNSSSSGLNQNSENSPTASTFRHKSRSGKSSSSRPKQRLLDAESPLPPMGRTRSSGSAIRKSTSGSMSSDGGLEDKDGPPPLPSSLSPVSKANNRGEPEGLKSGHRGMSRRGSAPTSTMFDNVPQPDGNKRDSFTKHNSMRNFDRKKGEGARKSSVPAASMPTADQFMMNESETSMDALSVMTEKCSNKTAEAPSGAIVTPSLAKNPAAALWK